jgi:hypothetical protein
MNFPPNVTKKVAAHVTWPFWPLLNFETLPRWSRANGQRQLRFWPTASNVAVADMSAER